MDLDRITATELVAALGTGVLSSREVLDALLARIDEHDRELRAVVVLDRERAQAAAAAADDAFARGERLGPLHGLPMTVKDTWETAGLVTTSGAPELRDHIPTVDALAVQRLKAAGAIVFGKTNIPLYAGDFQSYNDIYGVTSNPWDRTRTAGGSSGGAAVAVAAGFTPVELGSDIGGSIRVPAHFNGIYGFKPSWGVVPSRGHIPGPPGNLAEIDVNSNGPLARTIADLRLVFGIVAGPMPEDAAGGWRLDLDAGPPLEDLRGLRVGVVFDEGSDVHPVAADVRACLETFAAAVGAAGATVEAIPLPVSLADGLRAWQELVLPIMGLVLPDDVYAFLASLEGAPADDVVIRSGQLSAARFRDRVQADNRRQHQRVAWARLFEQVDVVLAPVMPTAAFPHDIERPSYERVLDVDGVPVSHLVLMAWCGAIGSVLLPVVAMPAGFTPGGLPVGVQVIGPYLSDRRLLRIAELLDVAGPGFVPPPLH